MGRQLILVIMLCSLVFIVGCGENTPSWLKFGPKTPQTPQAQTPLTPSAEEVQGTVLASINGRTITLEEFNEYINAYNAEVQASEYPEDVKQSYMLTALEDKKRILDGMVERELIIAEAILRGYKKDKQVTDAIKALQEQLLFAKLIEEERQKIGVTQQEIESFYTTNINAFVIPGERRVSEIVVPSEDRAKEILIQLLQGADFSVLARQYSTDKQSAQKGGDIGFIVRAAYTVEGDGQKTMFPAFEEMAFSLELNKSSTFIKGPSGYYLIKVTNIKETTQKPLTEVYNNIEQVLLLQKQEAAFETLVGNLRKLGVITIREELLR